ncbi:hypothetical protein DSLASN_15000 [Desulfoluna limicola]|uniref:Uncharacterized protein n=1 Tax=Desulfoluna limicola TaxID=2810562 RepID=A0ABM7PFM9_9BACT|nr:hypothetical protein [Desulfoluna limicola]BCS95868.1 hypothetical protein DSLASN_15000 [Desulfoluna limicola]
MLDIEAWLYSHGLKMLEIVLGSWFEESLRSIRFDKSMSWLLRLQRVMSSKALIAAAIQPANTP